jgi:F-type H+-transporting ATPase subunit delta
MVSVVHKRYAKALYDLAKDNQKVEKIEEEIQQIKDHFHGDTQLAKVLSQPRVHENEKLGILTKVFEGRISEEILGLITVILRKNRQQLLNQVFFEYLQLVKKGKNVSTAFITTAVPLSDEVKNKIHEKLKNTLNRDVEIQVNVNEELLGGMRVQIDHMVLDRSIKGRLDELKKAL